MTDILFIKTSSLGDVIHNMPAVAESRAHFPQARISWVVEEAYAPLVTLHPAVNEVIPVAWRRWRKELLKPQMWQQVHAWRRQLESRQFDQIIDSQGLIRTAIMSRFARGVRHGYDRDSIREPLAARFYDVRHQVSRRLHAIERNRRLTAAALGHQTGGAPDYGLNRAALRPTAGEPYALLLHGTARPEKEWPLDNWTALGNALQRRNLTLIVPWGGERERSRAGQIVGQVRDARLADRQPVDAVARLIAGADLVVGGDTGLVHLAAALRVPLVAIFSGSDPDLTRPIGAGAIEVVGAKGIMPSVEAVNAAVDRVFR